MIKICPICHKEFERIHNSQVYCCKKCADIAQRKRLSWHASNKNITPAIGESVKCANSRCDNYFVKKTPNQKFCCTKCKLQARTYRTPKTKSLTICEVSKIMNDMGYGNNYGKFCNEHPELLWKEV